MGKDFDDLLKVVGALVIGKLIIDALKNHRCPRCNYPVDSSNARCPNCGQALQWGVRNG